MEKTFTIYRGNCTVTVEVTQEKKDKIFEAILKWCEKYNCTSGEKLCQNDDCNIEAPNLLADIIDDIMNFETECD